jgi:hypothetical protein
MFFEEWESGLESMGCRGLENECVQAIEKKGLAGGRSSKLEGEFTDQYSV